MKRFICKFKVGDKVKLENDTLVYVIIKIKSDGPQCKYDLIDEDNHQYLNINEIQIKQFH